MARRPSPTTLSPEQTSFFEPRPVDLAGLDGVLRRSLSDTLVTAKSRLELDRTEIAAAINTLQPRDDRELTKHMLDRCCAPSATDWQLPAWRLPAICRVTDDYRLLEQINEACGFRAIPVKAAAIAELVMVELEQKRLRDRERQIKRGLSQEVIDLANRTLAGQSGR